MTNPIYQKQGTPVVWKDSGGDLVITLQNLAFGAGRQGATKDWGALSTARPTLYKFRLELSFETAPVVDEAVSIYWKSSDDNVVWDNDDGTGDIALSSTNKLRNLQLIGTLIVDEAVADVTMSVSGYFRNYERYGAPVIYNGSAGDNLQNTANDASLTITPVYDEIQ